ncbi:hypothetical protein QTO34_002580 [Cnephaeus nilssonii]|uniref:Uncharacterized protein n=1 Tax=Cnephaeus nilssonii TaxID=3371016 RepID=A0AA40HSI8_CNENI|nr:hypothetical protein QTO34_002580 [Eptesicus nilssonii]
MGRGGPGPSEPDASSGERRGSEALLCAPCGRAAAAAGAGRRDSRARAAQGWRGQAQAAGTGTSQLRTQCNWISEKNSLSSWFQGADWTQSENRPKSRTVTSRQEEKAARPAPAEELGPPAAAAAAAARLLGGGGCGAPAARALQLQRPRLRAAHGPAPAPGGLSCAGRGGASPDPSLPRLPRR